jgi:hypothetical protein
MSGKNVKLWRPGIHNIMRWGSAVHATVQGMDDINDTSAQNGYNNAPKSNGNMSFGRQMS